MTKILLILLLSVTTNIAIAQTMTPAEKSDFKKLCLELCHEMNQQAPMNVDENTIFLSMHFYNWVLTYNYKVNFSIDSFQPQMLEEFRFAIKKETTVKWKQEISSGKNGLSRQKWLSMMKTLNYRLHYSYVDADGNSFADFYVTYNDLK